MINKLILCGVVLGLQEAVLVLGDHCYSCYWGESAYENSFTSHIPSNLDRNQITHSSNCVDPRNDGVIEIADCSIGRCLTSFIMRDDQVTFVARGCAHLDACENSDQSINELGIQMEMKCCDGELCNRDVPAPISPNAPKVHMVAVGECYQCIGGYLRGYRNDLVSHLPESVDRSMLTDTVSCLNPESDATIPRSNCLQIVGVCMTFYMKSDEKGIEYVFRGCVERDECQEQSFKIPGTDIEGKCCRGNLCNTYPHETTTVVPRIPTRAVPRTSDNPHRGASVANHMRTSASLFFFTMATAVIFINY